MKTQNYNLQFGKSSVAELQQHQLLTINGGSGIAGVDENTNPCSGCVCDPVVEELTKKLRTIVN